LTPKQIDAFCSRLPGSVRTLQWKGIIVFKVGGTMFAAMTTDAKGHPEELSFKAPPEHYDTLSTARGFVPVRPRAKWVTLKDPTVLTDDEIRAYLRRAHAVIAATLPRKKQAELGLAPPVAARKRL
jgi:predicted DNA-binding protein (MmcQ/YjbR family)